jgi:hypothetical protein
MLGTYALIVMLHDEVQAHNRCCISCLFSSLCVRITIAELLILRFCDITSISEAEASGKITVIYDVTPCSWAPGINISEKIPSVSSCLKRVEDWGPEYISPKMEQQHQSKR